MCEALRRAMLELPFAPLDLDGPTPLIIELLKTDNGAEFVNHRVKLALAGAGIEWKRVPRRVPRLKPFIKSLNGKWKPLFDSEYPVIEIDDTGIGKEVSDKDFLCIAHDLIEDAIKKALAKTVAKYNDTVHDKLSGETPAILIPAERRGGLGWE